MDPKSGEIWIVKHLSDGIVEYHQVLRNDKCKIIVRPDELELNIVLRELSKVYVLYNGYSILSNYIKSLPEAFSYVRLTKYDNDTKSRFYYIIQEINER
jgi:hypothetical protein